MRIGTLRPRGSQFHRGVAYIERELRQGLSVVGPRRRHAAHHHVGVARGLDLFEPVVLDQPIEIRVDVIQELHQVIRSHIARPRSEASHVSEQDRSIVELVGDHRLRSALEAVGDRGGQNVHEQGLRALVFALRRRFGARRFA
jgi:hypothetical protein